MTSPSGIGVVVIGRNEAKNLPKLVDLLGKLGVNKTVYVDSISFDGSLSIAKTAGWTTCTLSRGGIVSAAAGRYVGTLVCDTEWILYLDGDMCPNIAETQRMLLSAQQVSDSCIVGFVGSTVDVYPDNTSRTRTQKLSRSRDAYWFGGAVLLKREAVLNAGNWNPSVYANEELDLYARLRCKGGRILFYPQVSFIHFTVRPKLLKTFLQLIGIYDVRNPKNGSLGYAVRSALSQRSLGALLSINPEPFVSVISILITLLSIWSHYYALALVAIPATAFWVSKRRGFQYIAVSYLLLFQIIIGLFRYRKGKVDYQIV